MNLVSKTSKTTHKREKIHIYNNALKSYNDIFENYFDQYMNFPFSKINPKNLFHDNYNYDAWYEELDDKKFKKLNYTPLKDDIEKFVDISSMKQKKEKK